MSGEPNAIVRSTIALEEASALDPMVETLRPVADALVSSPARRDLLQGQWLGHAIHPLMTMLPVGTWLSATLLDLFGGPQSRDAAQRLVGVGLAASVPTAVTGLAEWAVLERREQRIGALHAGANTVGLVLQTMSYRARRRGRHRTGAILSVGALSAAGLGGYLGGHLTEARKVSTRHPAYAS